MDYHSRNMSNSMVSDSSGSDMSDMSSSEVSWITWYCSLPEHEYFLEVPEDYIEDDFNLAGLSATIPLYTEALDMILDLEFVTSDDEADSGRLHRSNTPSRSHLRMVEASAEVLYGLIHARFLLTKPGLIAMAERYELKEFGKCPRIGCGGCGVVPCGLFDSPGLDTMKMFCPRCSDVYHPKKKRFHHLDGAFFGSTFPSLLFLSYPQLVPLVFSYSGKDRLQRDTRNPERALLARAKQLALDGSGTEDNRTNNSDSDDDYSDSGDISNSQNDDSKKLSDYQVFIPRIFGFRVSELSPTGPRMSWLRWKNGMTISTTVKPHQPSHVTNNNSIVSSNAEMADNVSTRRRTASLYEDTGLFIDEDA